MRAVTIGKHNAQCQATFLAFNGTGHHIAAVIIEKGSPIVVDNTAHLDLVFGQKVRLAGTVYDDVDRLYFVIKHDVIPRENLFYPL